MHYCFVFLLLSTALSVAKSTLMIPKDLKFLKHINTTHDLKHLEEIQCGVALGRQRKKDRSTGLLLRSLQKRIIGGRKTLKQEHPWAVYIYEKTNGKRGKFICGGAIIDKQWILTAAHCIKQPFSPEVYGLRIGTHSAPQKKGKKTIRGVVDIIMHKKYTKMPLSHDIALLKVDVPIEYNKDRRPLCLPDQGFPTDADNGKSFAGKRCIALGWGETKSTEKSNTLRQVSLNIVPHVLCQSFTSNHNSHSYNGMSVGEKDPVFCAGGEMGEDTCEGDSGGPIICQHENGQFYVHGVTSYGVEPCGQVNKPGVYTRVSNYRNWIDEKIRGNSS